ncbi:PQQ-binding-like beta-propeller repeat protein [Agrococcus versicolor]
MHALDRRTLLTGSAGLLGLGLLTLAGCASGDPAASPSPSASGPDPIDDALPDLTLTRLFGQKVTPSTAFYSMALAGDRVIVYDDTDTIEGRLLALDATTGATAWSFADVEPAVVALGIGATSFAPSTLVTAGADGDAVLLSTTYQNPCPGGAAICSNASTEATAGLGVVAVDLAGGGIRWHAIVVPSLDRSDPASTLANDSAVEPIGGTETVVVVRAGLAGLVVLPGGEAPEREEQARTIGLAAADGSVLWERPGLVVSSVTDVVVAMRREAGVVVDVVLDPDTGEELWQVESGLRVLEAGAGILAIGDQEAGRVLLVDSTTGEELATVSEGAPGDAALTTDVRIGTDVDGGPLAAWGREMLDVDVDDPSWRQWSWAGDEARPGIERSQEILLLSRIDAGYAWHSAGSTAVVACDRSGAARSERVLGTMRGIGAGRLLVESSVGFDLYEVA